MTRRVELCSVSTSYTLSRVGGDVPEARQVRGLVSGFSRQRRPAFQLPRDKSKA